MEVFTVQILEASVVMSVNLVDIRRTGCKRSAMAEQTLHSVAARSSYQEHRETGVLTGC
jgi:hypothetical protein